MDNLNFFFLSGLQKLEEWAKKCIDLCGEYVDQIPSLVAVACFLPGQDKDLSAAPRNNIKHTTVPHVPGHRPPSPSWQGEMLICIPLGNTCQWSMT